MDFPKTKDGNKHALVLQAFLTKWLMVYPMPDAKAVRIVKVLVEEFLPTFGVTEALCLIEGQTCCHIG